MKYYFCKRYFPYDSLYIKRFKELIFRFLHFDIQILKTLAKGVEQRLSSICFCGDDEAVLRGLLHGKDIATIELCVGTYELFYQYTLGNEHAKFIAGCAKALAELPWDRR